jgi:hypothetical protein
MKKKRNKEKNRANGTHGTHRTAEKKTDIQPMSANPAADLEQSLKSRMDVMKYRAQIRDIRVSESKSGRSLIVTILPEGEIVSFGTITVDLSGIDSDAKWKRKKKTVYGNVNGLTPRVNPAFYQKLREEVNAALQELLVLDHQQFKKISMIAQGEFAKLLVAPPKDKTRIFREIFGTGIYERFTQQLGQRARQLYAKVAEKKSKLEEDVRLLTVGLEKSVWSQELREHLQEATRAEHWNYDVLSQVLDRMEAEASE